MKALAIVCKTTGEVKNIVGQDEYPAFNTRTECVRVVEARLGRYPVRLALDPRTGEPHRWTS